MRFYFLGQNSGSEIIENSNDVCLDILEKTSISELSANMKEFEFSIGKKSTSENRKTGKFWIRENAGFHFFSTDKKNWSQLPLSEHGPQLKFAHLQWQFFSGFIPSGMGSTDPGSLVSQMPGKVVKVLVSASQEVQQGQTLLILEAMKMENELKAGISGKVAEVHVVAGETVDANQPLISLE